MQEQYVVHNCDKWWMAAWLDCFFCNPRWRAHSNRVVVPYSHAEQVGLQTEMNRWQISLCLESTSSFTLSSCALRRPMTNQIGIQ